MFNAIKKFTKSFYVLILFNKYNKNCQTDLMHIIKYF